MAEFNHNIDSIGTGALFPIQLSTDQNGNRGWYPVEGDVGLIENNLRSLVEYEIGQRFRQEEFGTRLSSCLEEPNNQALGFFVRKIITEAISRYEERIQIKRITTERDSAKIHIVMEYKVVGLNSDSYMSLTYNIN